ncbi:hypothetical protein C8R44DRAFT_787628 [Mycena epipterygia]|nr:hypothetical protein C8R44DRAFT_787628 [Mycena epipterygia]
MMIIPTDTFPTDLTTVDATSLANSARCARPPRPLKPASSTPRLLLNPALLQPPFSKPARSRTWS